MRPRRDVLLHQNRLSKEVADRLRALAEHAPRFIAEEDYRESRHQPLQPPRCNGKGRGVHSLLRSGVEQRSFAHTVLPLGALPLPLSDVGRKQRPSRPRTRYEHRPLGRTKSSHAYGGGALELHLISSHFSCLCMFRPS